MMNQSTSFAQVATNLLNVLQGYTKGIRFLLVMFLTLTVSAEVLGADKTVTWTASSGALGSGIGSGTIKTGTYSWNYTRTLKSGTSYTGWTENCIQLGKNGGVENITFTTSAIPGTIKSVSVACSSYNNAHKVSIKVGNTTYLSSTATPKWTTVSAKTGTGTSSGQIVISFTDGSRALYIKSISVTYEEAATCTTPPTVTAASNSNITSTTATVSCPDGITSLGSAGCSITSYGFVYGTSSDPTISNTTVTVLVGTTYTTTDDDFSKELTGLTANTTYYVRPYATNGNGTAYGTQTSFKTLELPKYTVNLSAGPGSCAESVTETSAGAGVDLPTPNICDGWTFAGWATSAVATETSSKPATLLTGTYKPTSNITLYAVYQRTETTEGTPTVTTTTDKLTRTTTGISDGSGYGTWSGKKATSSAVYAGQSAGGNNAIQLRTTNSNSGIITTASGGKATKITVEWNSNTADGRTLDIYGKNSAYSAATDLYSTSTQGTKLGSIVNGTSTELTISGDYEYIGLRSNSNAMYLTSISIDWATSTGGGTSSTTYYHSTPECTTETTVCLVHKYGRARYGLVPDGNGVLTVW